VDVVEHLQWDPVLQPHGTLVLLRGKLTVQLHALTAVGHVTEHFNQSGDRTQGDRPIRRQKTICVCSANQMEDNLWLLTSHVADDNWFSSDHGTCGVAI
jgi:hypothetical protein